MNNLPPDRRSALEKWWEDMQNERMLRVDQTEFGEFGNCNSACIAMVLGLPIDQVPNWTKVDGSDNDRFEAMQAWLRNLGWGMLSIERGAMRDWPPKHGVYIAGGPSARGHEHAVIYRDGELWHDPHPERAGLQFVRTLDVIYPLEPVAWQARVPDDVARDAARYRWLKRDAECEESTHSILFETPASEWDAAIDAAERAGEEG